MFTDFRRLASASALAMAAVITVGAQEASALTFDATFNGTIPQGTQIDYSFDGTNTDNGRAGAFSMTATDQGQNSALIGNFLAWCFDLSGGVSAPNSYEFEVADFLATDARDRVQSVFDFGYQDVLDNATDAVKRAGFQVAIWEAIYDGLGVAGLTDTTGRFELRNTGQDPQDVVLTAAAGFLTGASGLTPSERNKWTILQLDATGAAVQDLGAATPIPLPAAAWLLLAASGGLIAAKRRQSRQA